MITILRYGADLAECCKIGLSRSLQRISGNLGIARLRHERDAPVRVCFAQNHVIIYAVKNCEAAFAIVSATIAKIGWKIHSNNNFCDSPMQSAVSLEKAKGQAAFRSSKDFDLGRGVRSERIVAPRAVQGPICGEKFLAPVLKPEDVVIMDNLICRKSASDRDAIEEKGADLRFLLRYGADPIKLAFAEPRALVAESPGSGSENSIAESLRLP